MLIFFDTEFTDLCIDPRLISLGLVSENGLEFYAELDDTYQIKDCSAFVQEVVLPHLEGGAARMAMHELSLRLGNWIESFEQPMQLATDSLSWDWPWIQEIFHTPNTWPENLDGKPLILTQSVEFNLATEKAFGNGLRRHHALDDAKANRLGWMAPEPIDPDEFERAMMYDDGAAAKSHLAAGRCIYYGEDKYPGEIIKEHPDGRRQIVVMSADNTFTVVREIPPQEKP